MNKDHCKRKKMQKYEKQQQQKRKKNSLKIRSVYFFFILNY